jgi:subtilase family serine protease
VRAQAARTLTTLLLVGLIGLLIPVAGTAPGARAAAPPPRVLRGRTPAVVVDGSAVSRGQQDPATPLTLNVGLAAHDSAALDALIAAVSDPTSPSYGHYLTPAQYMVRFAPTDADVAAVRVWAAAAGLQVGAVSPDHLLMTVRATTGAVEQALGVRVNTYSLRGRLFQANDRDPTVPANLDIRAISGLSTLNRFHVMQRRMPMTRAQTRTGTRTGDVRLDGFYPDDFRAAYNAGPVGDGSGQTIGFTLWGAPLPQSDLDTFAANTGTPRLVGGQSGNDGVDWISVDGAPSTDTSVLDEVALDVEYAHGVASHSHLKYWLAPCGYDPSLGYCNPSNTGLENAVNAAAHAHDTDPSLHAVSNSWGGNEPATADDMAFASNIDASLQYAASQGVTFYFSSGDFGYASGTNCDPSKSICTQALPSYPADSPYAVAVGGTTLDTGAGYSYGSETAWNGSGGGCSIVEPRPVWQTGVAAAPCAGRAEPDVSAVADPSTGAYVFFNGRHAEVGGTSLAAPLWAGMMTDVNRSLTDAGHPPTGFAAPRLYALATNATTYGRDFHDVTIGNNDPTGSGGAYVQSAGVRWDEVTGWGSPNLANLAADWTGAGGVSVATATSPPNTTPGPSATPSPSSTPGAGAVPTATATPAPTDTATPSPVPTSTNTSTATPSPTNTSTSTATPSPTNTSTSTATASSTPTDSTTPTATATARPVSTATTAAEVFTSTSVRVAATPTARATHPVRRLRAVKPTATPVVSANVRAPNGGVTLNSVVTVDGRTRPGVTVAISASLITTSTISQRAVIYAPTTASAPRSSSKKGVKPAARTCRKDVPGCVARVVTRRVVRTTLLYQTRTATRARADRGGRFSARVRLDYRPRTTARVMLTVTLITAAPRGRFVRALLVKVAPPPLPKSGHVGLALKDHGR